MVQINIQEGYELHAHCTPHNDILFYNQKFNSHPVLQPKIKRTKGNDVGC